MCLMFRWKRVGGGRFASSFFIFFFISLLTYLSLPPPFRGFLNSVRRWPMQRRKPSACASARSDQGDGRNIGKAQHEQQLADSERLRDQRSNALSLRGSVVSWISILVVGSLIGEAVLLPRVAYDLRIFGSGWAAVTTIPPVRNLLPPVFPATPGDGTPTPPAPVATPFIVPFVVVPLVEPAAPPVDGTLSSAFRGEPAVERELVPPPPPRQPPQRTAPTRP
uniref:Uncharacterized protein n=1 Tax=Anopheles dirus TaxID=7168 RepID=A0A182NVZ7_9DIPT